MNLCEIKPNILKITQFIPEYFNVIFESILGEPVCSGLMDWTFILSASIFQQLCSWKPQPSQGIANLSSFQWVFSFSSLPPLYSFSFLLSSPSPFSPLSCSAHSAVPLPLLPLSRQPHWRPHRPQHGTPGCMGARRVSPTAKEMVRIRCLIKLSFYPFL